ncbi:hypothetical protein ACIQ4Z_07860 [Peribacillus asahii]|uniref:hypothetical protein n=1 Tax=Peribacillus asahii TaxID=228899 RepID=UPI0037F44707
MNESKISHLEMIQNIITRMNSNSFLLKGWTVTIFVGLFAFANVTEMDSRFIIIALIPTVIFMFLDSYFLRQERLFRHLYEYVRTTNDRYIDFSMSTKRYQKQKDTKYLKVILSKTIWPCYVPIIAVTLIIFLKNPYVTNFIFSKWHAILNYLS